jgi:hypothetical protein
MEGVRVIRSSFLAVAATPAAFLPPKFSSVPGSQRWVET